MRSPLVEFRNKGALLLLSYSSTSSVHTPRHFLPFNTVARCSSRSGVNLTQHPINCGEAKIRPCFICMFMCTYVLATFTGELRQGARRY
ncbi:hypothetical protein BDV34DRAFT_92344 [Aspergillus parasiticus]|uniref:Uncharacterized protein n=1 Tax=Aspergillus parasiticus TaxID=5067 RepID=A0A5N6DM87_ASPPA|nr:hypothetical protein BDV34DRAFT_92344 [Aspergillus parasiticus]